MQIDHRAELSKIKRFDQLIAYLRDEMGWPIAQDSFEDVDDLFYDFTPDELGIDVKNAAKIQEIKRLRPLSPKQPWGIFFIKFEPKRLPVVALRRILGQVALKKRASANSAEMAAWAADDLLFVSNYGEGEERQISFAHFSKAQDGHDLPTLKVLGWDNLDTALHLDAVVRELTEHLAWPDDDTDVEAWRERWRAAFTLRHREVITTSKELSTRLAELARAIRDRIKTALAIETPTGPLTKLMKAFQEALVHDLDADGFADMYAQTIAYGLLSARIADPKKRTADDFAGHMRTNPFLRDLMETFLKVGGRRGKVGGPGIDFDELGVTEVVELLDDANMEAVARDFGDKNPQEDPVIHFYELFLKEYDAKKRIQRGVFYTPRPVVSYIVRSVDALLRTELDLADGLADTTTWGEMAKRNKNLKIPDGVEPGQVFVQILDPATGTGTFLVEVIDLIYRRMTEKWKALGHGEEKIEALWNDYVPKNLLPRLHGYELLMAPYAIAHLKIGLKLHATRYRFGSDERARVYLTNALEPASDTGQMRLTGILPALAHEAQAVNEIKRSQRFTVVIGNPPYAQMSANMTEYALSLINPYRFINGTRIVEKSALSLERNLNDDYIKFLRLAERYLEDCPGVVGLITNNSYIDAITLRGLRWNLLRTFTALRILNLHGDSDKRDVAPDGSPDKNVFEIKKGVAIILQMHVTSSRASGEPHAQKISELRGTTKAKLDWLTIHTASDTDWLSMTPREPNYLFVVQVGRLTDEYADGVSLAELMPEGATGFTSGYDEVLTGFLPSELASSLREFSTQPRSVIAGRFTMSGVFAERTFGQRRLIAGDHDLAKRIKPFLFAPFDMRFAYYRQEMIMTASYRVGRNLLEGKNIALMLMRQVSIGSGFSHAFVTRHLPNNRAFYSTKGKVAYFPLFILPEREGLLQTEAPSTNFNSIVGMTLAGALTESGGTCPAESMLAYCYAILSSPNYRSRYDSLLRSDYPRIPIPREAALGHKLVELGQRLVALHLMESPKLSQFITTYDGPKNPEVGRVGWSDDTVWLDAASTKKGQATTPGTTGFRGVPEAVWNFHIGGYQVCEKWLKDRKGRILTAEDITHYQKIVVALSETIRLMKEIDEVIEEHGGWPGAFAQAQQTIRPDEVVNGYTIKTKAIQTEGNSNKREEAQLKIILIKEKETPGTWRFKEDKKDHPMTIYLTKEQVKELGDPQSIKVIIEAA